MKGNVIFASRYLIMAGVVTALLVLPGCERPPHDRGSTSAAAIGSDPVHDLSRDEAEGGHTLHRHVGRTDTELKQRLDEEPNISAASTYSDRATAERAVGAALEQNRAKIERWLQRPGSHPNLVVDYDGDPRHPLGRSWKRGADAPEPCSQAVVVLKWDGNARYHVLTTYPECR
jgi:hypothetical protein